jgi:cytochrome c biogenesis protein CcmG, thiol:disulfide interchange protein DsbE
MSTDAVSHDADLAEYAPEAEAVDGSRRIGVTVLALIVVVVLVLFGFALAPRSSSATASVTGQQLSQDPRGAAAPDFTGTVLDTNAPLALSSLRGKTVVVNFWASWCSTCKAEAATVAAVEARWRSKGVVFVGIDTHDTTAGAKTYEQTYGLGYASVVDPDSRIGAQYGVTGLPETFFLDSRGVVVTKFVSSIDDATLDRLIAQTVAAG